MSVVLATIFDGYLNNYFQLTSRLWADGDQYRYAVPPRTGDHWERIMKRIDLYDEDICKGWREDIDTLLVFVSLKTLERNSQNNFLFHTTGWAFLRCRHCFLNRILWLVAAARSDHEPASTATQTAASKWQRHRSAGGLRYRIFCYSTCDPH